MSLALSWQIDEAARMLVEDANITHLHCNSQFMSVAKATAENNCCPMQIWEGMFGMCLQGPSASCSLEEATAPVSYVHPLR